MNPRFHGGKLRRATAWTSTLTSRVHASDPPQPANTDGTGIIAMIEAAVGHRRFLLIFTRDRQRVEAAGPGKMGLGTPP